MPGYGGGDPDDSADTGGSPGGGGGGPGGRGNQGGADPDDSADEGGSPSGTASPGGGQGPGAGAIGAGDVTAGSFSRLRDYNVPSPYARAFARAKNISLDEAINEIVDARHAHNPTAEQTGINSATDMGFGAANPGVTGLMDVAMTALGGIPGFGAVSAIGNLTNKAEGRPSVGFGISDVFGSATPGIADKARAGITDAARSGVTSVGDALAGLDESISSSIGSTPSVSDTSRAGGPGRDGGGAATDGSDQQVPITTQTPTGIAAVATPSLTRTALDSSHNSVIDTWRQILGDSIFGTRRIV